MSNRGFLATLAAIGFIALLAFGLIAKGGPTLAVGDAAPDSPVEVVGEEREASLADYRGKWVLLNFWASWCEPCRDEAPAIEKFARANQGDLVVLGMASRDATPDIEAFAEEFGITYELLRDGDGNRMDAYNVKGLPESFLIDPQGKIAFVYRGPVDEEILDAEVQPLISGVEPA